MKIKFELFVTRNPNTPKWAPTYYAVVKVADIDIWRYASIGDCYSYDEAAKRAEELFAYHLAEKLSE